MGVFYVDEGLIILRDPEWIQGAVNILIRLFLMVFLMANVEKSNTLTFQSGAIHIGMLDEAFSWRSTWEGATYRERL